MTIAVRPAAEADLPAVRQVLMETWHATYDAVFGADMVTEITGRWHSLDALRGQLNKAGTAFLVAERDGALVATLYASPGCDGVLMLERLYVLPAMQGHGVGRALWRAMLDRFAGARSVRLEVHPANGPAIAFYRRLGFVDAGSGTACGGDQDAAIDHLMMENAL